MNLYRYMTHMCACEENRCLSMSSVRRLLEHVRWMKLTHTHTKSLIRLCLCFSACVCVCACDVHNYQPMELNSPCYAIFILLTCILRTLYRSVELFAAKLDTITYIQMKRAHTISTWIFHSSYECFEIIFLFFFFVFCFCFSNCAANEWERTMAHTAKPVRTQFFFRFLSFDLLSMTDMCICGGCSWDTGKSYFFSLLRMTEKTEHCHE